MSIEKRLLSSTAGNVVSLGVNFANSVVLVPILLMFWGKETYGIWLSLSALLMTIITLDTGYQFYLGNELARSYANRERDGQQFKQILASGFLPVIVLVLLELCMAVVLVGSDSLPSVLGLSPEAIHGTKVNLVFIVMVVGWVSTGSIGGILGSVYYASGFLSRSIWIGTAVRITNVFIMAVCAWQGGSLLTVVLLINIPGFLILFFFVFDLRKKLPGFYPFWSGGSWQTGWHNLKKSFFMTGAFSLEHVRNSGLLLVISSSLGIGFVPILTTVRTLGNLILQFSNTVIIPLFPEMIRYDTLRDHEKLGSLWSLTWWLVGGLTNLGLLVLVLIVEPLYATWTGGELNFLWSLYLLLSWSVSLQACNLPLMAYLKATNYLEALSVTAITQTAIVLGLAVLLVKPLGLVGVGIAIVGGEVLGPTWLSRFYARKKLKGLKGRFPVGHDYCCLLACAVVGLVYLAFNSGYASKTVSVSIGITILVALYSAEWFLLPADMRRRMLNLVLVGMKMLLLKKSPNTSVE